jgi:hypothetical protein
LIARQQSTADLDVIFGGGRKYYEKWVPPCAALRSTVTSLMSLVSTRARTRASRFSILTI